MATLIYRKFEGRRIVLYTKDEGDLLFHSVVPLCPLGGDEEQEERENGSNFTPRESDIALLYGVTAQGAGQHFDVLELHYDEPDNPETMQALGRMLAP